MKRSLTMMTEECPPKRKSGRGRSLTVRKNATNSRDNRLFAEASCTGNTTTKLWWQRLAMFGESYGALVASTVLLGTAFCIWIYMEIPAMGGNVGGPDVGDALAWIWERAMSSWSWGLWGGLSAMPMATTSNGWSDSRDCSIHDNAIPALGPGDLNRLFEDIAAKFSSSSSSNEANYTATILSGSKDTFQEFPWILTLDNFLSDEECEVLIKLGGELGFGRSMDVGQSTINANGSFGKITARRTSSSTWCTSKSGCRIDEIPDRVHRRISKLLNISIENSEDLQILKYDVGQFYKIHHDYIPHQRNRQCGPRILTLFIYLNDVPAGGETFFPLSPKGGDRNVTVKPKRGMALLFPNVRDNDPMEADMRTRHAALPVLRGTKYAVNAWIHLYDYQAAVSNGCN